MESIAPSAVFEARPAALPWHVSAMLVGSTSIVLGILWDISWHMTIGRDTFWTPAHMAIYLGGVLAGICGGWLALKTTFAGTPEERGVAVRFWGFRAPLGAWVAIWGALAMLTSAPFDDWWHNAYGLDVEILSPPHTVLAAGMIAIQLGAMLLVLAPQNRAADSAHGARGARGLGLAFLYAAGAVLSMLTILLTEYSYPNVQHAAFFYKVSCGVYPVLLVAAARASRLRWAATLTAAFYMLITLAMVWILPLFPAQPMLGPIENPVDHMVPPGFPLLLIVPALAVDWILQRRGKNGGWLMALGIAAAFLALFFVSQWLFAEFLLSPASRNRLFAGDMQWSYGDGPGDYRYRFWTDEDPLTPAGLGAALLLGILATRVGLWWGSWMSRVRR
ncbi:MAG TPA: hypothetical protein VNM67_20205 [Thermoanaerobaculia bacterium]|jgi:hypothetical protein|nr:hypothetical protein [Thermoanaerobaculia bacterium]